jgi:transcriptional regulator with XRE-family HTH domain
MTGRELKRRRTAAGLTQVELGDRIGIAGNSIARYEAGRVSITADVELLLNRALPPKDTTVDDATSAGMVTKGDLVGYREFERLVEEVSEDVAVMATATRGPWVDKLSQIGGTGPLDWANHLRTAAKLLEGVAHQLDSRNSHAAGRWTALDSVSDLIARATGIPVQDARTILTNLHPALRTKTTKTTAKTTKKTAATVTTTRRTR